MRKPFNVKVEATMTAGEVAAWAAGYEAAVSEIVADLKAKPIELNCRQCGGTFHAGHGTNKRTNAFYCSNKCRVAAWRANHVVSG